MAYRTVLQGDRALSFQASREIPIAPFAKVDASVFDGHLRAEGVDLAKEASRLGEGAVKGAEDAPRARQVEHVDLRRRTEARRA